MTSKELKAEIRKLKSQEKRLAEALGKALAKRDRLDDDRLDDKAERDRLKRRKEAGKVYDEDALARLNT